MKIILWTSAHGAGTLSDWRQTGAPVLRVTGTVRVDGVYGADDMIAGRPVRGLVEPFLHIAELGKGRADRQRAEALRHFLRME